MKLKVFTIFIFCLILMSQTAVSQSPLLPWQNKAAAVVLTYDDALNVDHTNVIPALDKYGLKGTFYIGNHTVYHPCTGSLPGREFVKPDYDLNNYSIRRITDEIKTMNTLLQSIDGKTKRTFAFPCSDTKIRDTPYLDGVKNEFIAARAVRSEMPTIDKVEIFNLPGYGINGETGYKLIDLVKQGIAKKALLIFLFHGVGGEHSLNVSLEAHAELLQFLKQHEKEVWVAPMIDVAEYITSYQKKVNS